jgi:hypothetical protein
MTTMFSIFQQYLIHITETLITHYKKYDNLDTTQFRVLYRGYGSLYRMYEQSEEFVIQLQIWHERDYHGAAWARCQQQVESIYHNLMILENDIDALPHVAAAWPFRLHLGNHELPMTLRMQLRGPLQPTQDVLRCWTDVLRHNAEDHFCGWETIAVGNERKKRLLIPNYSLLVTTIPTAAVQNLTESSWYTPFATFFQPVDQHDTSPFAYLPELPQSHTTHDSPHLVPNAAMTVVVSNESSWLADIIEQIRINRSSLGRALTHMRALLLIQAQDSFERIIPPINAIPQQPE